MDWFDTGKDLFNKGKRWLETSGDMISASINPKEKTLWMDEQQKKIEKQQKTAPLQPVIPKVQKQENTFAPMFQSDAVPDTSKTQDNEPVFDWSGHPVSEEERQRILSTRAQERAKNSDDINEALDDLKKLRQQGQQDVHNRMAFRFDSDITKEKTAKPQPSAFERAAGVNVPEDETMMPAFRHLGEAIMKALGNNSAVSGYGRAPAGMTDQSYKPATDVVADNITENLGNKSAVSGYGRTPAGHSDMSYKSATDALADNITRNLGDKSAVSGYGRVPVGYTDQSYGPAIGDVTKNFGLGSAVTGKGTQVIGHPNMSYWGNWDDEALRKMPLDITSKGVQQGMKDMQILFYSGGAVLGENLFNLVGGDDQSLRRVQGILDWHQKELKGMKRMTSDQVYIEGDPERSMQNLSRYLYQELGSQTVKLPAYYVGMHLKTFAEAFGVSHAVISSQLYRDYREKSGDGHAAESVMYSVPLALLSAAVLPFRDASSFTNVKMIKDYIQSMVVGVAVHKAREEGRKKMVDGLGGKRDDDILR